MTININIDPHNLSCFGLNSLGFVEACGGELWNWALRCPNDMPFSDFFSECYQGFESAYMPEGSSLNKDNFYCFTRPSPGLEDEPEEPPLAPLIVFTRKYKKKTETLYIYQYGICAFVSSDKPTIFVRLD